MSNLSKNLVSQLEVKLGEVFSIKIKGNSTTGYSWVLAQMPSNIYLLSTDYVVDPHKRGMVGVGGTYTFTFKAMEKSTKETEIVFEHLRPWMSESEGTKVWKVNVTDGAVYEHIEGCFVNNTVEQGKFHLVIDNVEQFYNYFGNAGSSGPFLTASDFEKHIVVAVILPSEQRLRKFTVDDLTVANKNLTLDYTLSEGKSITWTVRVPLILLVEKGNYGTVSFYENKKMVEDVKL